MCVADGVGCSGGHAGQTIDVDKALCRKLLSKNSQPLETLCLKIFYGTCFYGAAFRSTGFYSTGTYSPAFRDAAFRCASELSLRMLGLCCYSVPWLLRYQTLALPSAGSSSPPYHPKSQITLLFTSCVRVPNVTVVCKRDRVVVDPTRSDEHHILQYTGVIMGFVRVRRGSY